MKETTFTITENVPIAAGTYRMVLAGDTDAVTAPGQFVNIALPGRFLRRPISVCDAQSGSLTLLYKTVGSGTEQMAAMGPGQELDLLTGLGNGFSLDGCGERPLLAGGGIGTAPLYWLAKRLASTGIRPRVVMGFNRGEDVFYTDEFAALGADVTIATADGSRGMKGFVTDAMAGLDYTYVYACGPEPMLRAVWERTQTDGQFSFEARMGCGFGACVGCTRQTVRGPKRVCKDGPVFRKGEILWGV